VKRSGIRALPATVWLLAAISLCNDTASELVYPLLPLYLVGVLGAGPRVLGLLEGVAEATGSLFKLFAGVVTDRRGSGKAWVVAGYAAGACARAGLAFAAVWPVVLALRVVDRVGKGIRTAPRDALLARTVDPAMRGLAFGVHRAMDNAGSVIGPLAAWALLASGVSFHGIFLWTIVPGAITVGLALCLREPPPAPPTAAPPAFSWRISGLPPAFRRYLLVVALFTLGNSSNTFLLLRAADLGLKPQDVPLLWAVMGFVAMALSVPLSRLSDRLGRRRIIAWGWVLYAVFYLALGLLTTAAPLWLLFAVYGAFQAATEGAERALVADLAPQALLGTAYGWFHLVVGLGLFPASFLFGTVWSLAGPLTAFGLAAGCAGLAAWLLVRWVVPATPCRRRSDTSGP
jgi:MFS family permease